MPRTTAAKNISHADRVAPRVAVSIASIYNMETPPAVAELLQGLDLEDLSSIVNLETWRRLSPADRASLSALLPSASAAGDGSVETLLATEVFTLSNRRFGSPLSHFLEAFQSGALTAEALAADVQADAQHAAAWETQRRAHHNAMVHKLHMRKNSWKPAVPRAPKAYYKRKGGPAAAGNLMYSKEAGGLVRKDKSGGAGVPLGRPFLHEQGRVAVAGASKSPQSIPGGTGSAGAAAAGGHGAALMPGLMAGFPTGLPSPGQGVIAGLPTPGGGGGTPMQIEQQHSPSAQLPRLQ